MNWIKENWKVCLVIVVLMVVNYFTTREVTKISYELKVNKAKEETISQTKVNWDLTRTNIELRNTIERLEESRTEEITERKNVDGSSVKETKIVYQKKTEKESKEKSEGLISSNVNVDNKINSKKESESSFEKFNKEVTKSGSGWGVGVLYGGKVGGTMGGMYGGNILTPKFGPFRGQAQFTTSDQGNMVGIGILLETK